MFWWWYMPTIHWPTIKFPLSGAVTQDIETSLLRQSRKADVERDVLREVASYGKQIGKLNEALLALAGKAGLGELDEVAAVHRLQAKVEAVKRRYPVEADSLRTDLDRLRAQDEAQWRALAGELAGKLRAPEAPGGA